MAEPRLDLDWTPGAWPLSSLSREVSDSGVHAADGETELRRVQLVHSHGVRAKWLLGPGSPACLPGTAGLRWGPSTACFTDTRGGLWGARAASPLLPDCVINRRGLWAPELLKVKGPPRESEGFLAPPSPTNM